jgi:outer membrane protein
MNRYLFLLALLGLAPLTRAQTTAPRLSLTEALRLAQQNSLLIRQARLDLESGQIQWQQARQNRLPTLNLFASQAFSSGRNINPTTNQFVEQQVTSNSYQLGSAVTLFNGFALTNAVRQADLFRQSAQAGVDAAQLAVTLAVLQGYLQVLTTDEQLDVARRQVETSRAQVERTRRLVDAGTVAEGTLFDLEAQQAADALAVVNARNAADLAKLTLVQALNLPDGTELGTFSVEKIPLIDPTQASEISATAVYQAALERFPDVRAADLQVRSDELGIRVARAGRYPSLSLEGGVSTLYSSLGLQRFVADGTTIVRESGEFITIGGVQQPVLSESPGGAFVDYRYLEQLRNNLNRSVSLNLRVPLLNNFQTRNRIATAVVLRNRSQVAAQNVRLQLRQAIETAVTTLRAAANRFAATSEQVRALERAFATAQSRLDAGTLNAAEYLLAKTALDRARADQIQARYDYALRTQMLELYQGGR